MKITHIVFEPLTMSELFGEDTDADNEPYPTTPVHQVHFDYDSYSIDFLDVNMDEVYKMIDVHGDGYNNIITPFIDGIRDIRDYQGD